MPGEHYQRKSTQWITDFERVSGTVVFTEYGDYEEAATLWASLEKIAEKKLVDLLDYRLSSHTVQSHYTHDDVKRLERLLDEANAGWRVGPRGRRYGLLKRIPEGSRARSRPGGEL